MKPGQKLGKIFEDTNWMMEEEMRANEALPEGMPIPGPSQSFPLPQQLLDSRK